MSAQEKQEERDFILEVIKLYEELPALWNVKSKDYTNRNKKQYQYEILLRKYRERYPAADKIQLLKKFNSLRTNFRKELRRINAAKKTGNGELSPTLWYFEEMKFLIGQTGGDDGDLSTLATARLKDNSNNVKYKFEQKCSTRNQFRTSHEPTTTQRSSHTKNNSVSKLRTVPKYVAIKANNVTPSRQLVPDQNEFEQIAALWSIELQKMDAKQQLFAKKAINDILFEGQLGNLHRNSIEINRINQEETNFCTGPTTSLIPTQPSVIYENGESNVSDFGNFKFEIEHNDPIEVDNNNNNNNSSSEFIEEDENTQNMEISGEELRFEFESSSCSLAEEESNNMDQLKEQKLENQMCSSGQEVTKRKSKLKARR